MNKTGKTICLIGQTGSGKSTIAEMLMSEHGYRRINITDALRDYSSKIGFLNPTRAGLQMIANETRSQFGSGFFAQHAMDGVPQEENIVVEGIRHKAELEKVRRNRDAVLVIGVESDQKTRFERVLMRRKDTDPTSFKEFQQNDEREWGKGQDESSQNTRSLMNLIDVKVINSRGVSELRSSLYYVLQTIGWHDLDPELQQAYDNIGENGLVIFNNEKALKERETLLIGKER